MRSVLHLALAAVLAAGAAEAGRDRTVMAWGSGDPAVVAQLRNESWRGVFDGVQALCGVGTSVEGITVNATLWAGCAELRQVLKEQGAELHVWVGGIPQEVIENPARREAFKRSAVAQAKALGIDGYSLDDESDCAPRSTLQNFTQWMGFVNELTDDLHEHGVQVSAAVQAMFGIQDVPYKPLCFPAEQSDCSQACSKAPYAYAPLQAVTDMMRSSSLDRWLEMDTYYFTTARFLDALDYYTGVFAPDRLGHLGVTVENRPDVTEEGVIARFHAIEKSEVDWINVFNLPAQDKWLPWLRRWKTRCAQCPNRGVLSCYDPAVPC
eukprot:TRINITY_DN32918_c0_g1_i1.p1 TRINITY_DN32918_c0_g1~~TRINITY_DN32918_c0_g1_i1.p1  ORF type:complete len:323 (+),score=107.96 TRINITY_DN32918_c0_g1_i1:42-1010(+)